LCTYTKTRKMILQIEKQKSCMVVKINSEKLDSLIAPELKAELVNINTEGAKNIIIDMSDARYCDSSGLSAILVGNRLCKNSGGMLVLTGLKESVKKLILISQLDSILNTALTLEEGISLIGEPKTSK
jgi:anti-sigma B factor antagonist